MARASALLGVTLVSISFAVPAQDDPAAPGLDFLEYLGSWQETDEEWVIISEWDGENPSPPEKKGRQERKDDE